MSYHTLHLKSTTFKLLPTAKKEFLRHHPELKETPLSNNKIVFEALRYYIGTGAYKDEVLDLERGDTK